MSRVRIAVAVAVATATASLMLGVGAGPGAASEPIAPRPVPAQAQPQAEGPDGADRPAPQPRVYHKGQRKNFARDGWGTAKVCVEVDASIARYDCYDSEAEADADLIARGILPSVPTPAQRSAVESDGAVAAASDSYYAGCPNYWTCLYEHSYYNDYQTGRMLKWSQNGAKELGGDLAFRDKASSMVNYRAGAVTLQDYRTGYIDPTLFFCAVCDWTIARLSVYSHPQGNWNDRADRITLS